MPKLHGHWVGDHRECGPAWCTKAGAVDGLNPLVSETMRDVNRFLHPSTASYDEQGVIVLGQEGRDTTAARERVR